MTPVSCHLCVLVPLGSASSCPTLLLPVLCLPPQCLSVIGLRLHLIHDDTDLRKTDEITVSFINHHPRLVTSLNVPKLGDGLILSAWPLFKGVLHRLPSNIIE